MSRMTEMCHAMQDYCNENYGPEDIPNYEICPTCNGCGYSHPPSGAVCEHCSGAGAFECDGPRIPQDTAND